MYIKYLYICMYIYTKEANKPRQNENINNTQVCIESAGKGWGMRGKTVAKTRNSYLKIRALPGRIHT